MENTTLKLRLKDYWKRKGLAGWKFRHLDCKLGYAKWPILVAILCIAGSLASCLKSEDFEGLELETASPTLAFSLLTTNVLADDLVFLIDSAATAVSEEAFELTFPADRYSQRVGDFLDPIAIGLPFPILDTAVTVPIPSIDGITVRQAVLDGESLVFTLNSRFEDTVHVQFRLPALTRDGQIFSPLFEIVPSGSANTQFISQPISLAGLHLDLSNGLFPIAYDARLPDGERVRLSLSFVQLTAFEFSYLEGNIGRISIPSESQTIDIALPDSLLTGDIRFAQPRIEFDLINSFGVPVGIQVLELNAVSSDGSQTAITSPLFAEPIHIAYPLLEQRGDSARQTIVLDRSNSNIADVLDPSIRELRYQLEVILNPLESQSDQFFVSDSSIAILDAAVVLPLEVAIENLNINYRLPLDVDPIESVQSLRVKLYAENEIPLNFSPALQFEGLANRIRLQAIDNAVIREASISQMNSTPQVSELYFPISGQDLQIINAADSLTLMLGLTTSSSNDFIQITPGQNLFIGLGVEAQLAN